MAQLEKLIPFILYFEAGGAESCKIYETRNGKKVLVGYDPSKATPEQQYNECKNYLLKNNKLVVSGDKGGMTLCGVTYSTYATYCNKVGIKATESGLKSLKYSDWYKILHTMFWNRWKADNIENQAVANILVDWVWASGITGVKRPQRLLGVDADGIVGPKTLAAVKAAEEETAEMFFFALQVERLKHINEIVEKSPSQAKFYKGWERRINAITFDGFKYV
jgi:lysozyme family protein